MELNSDLLQTLLLTLPDNSLLVLKGTNKSLYGGVNEVLKANIYWKKRTAIKLNISIPEEMRDINWKDVHDSCTTLEDLLLRPELSLVQFAIDSGIDPSFNNDAALINASRLGRLDIVKVLDSNGVDLSTQEDIALITACSHDKVDVVEFLVDNGANIQARNNDPINRAARSDSVNVCKFLVSKGVNYDRALVGAALIRKPNALEFFLQTDKDRGADPNSYLRTRAMEDAACRNNAKEVRLLIEYGTDPTYPGNDSLKYAAELNAVDALREILKYNIPTKQIVEAIEYALKKGHNTEALSILTGK